MSNSDPGASICKQITWTHKNDDYKSLSLNQQQQQTPDKGLMHNTNTPIKSFKQYVPAIKIAKTLVQQLYFKSKLLALKF